MAISIAARHELHGLPLAPLANGWVAGVLQRLDDLLARAFQRVQAPSPDDFAANLPGLVVTANEVERLLGLGPAGELTPPAVDTESAGCETPRLADDADPRWARLRDEFELDPSELDVLALSIAVDLDLKYQHVFAWLQDDLTRQRPNLNLTLNLLCPNTKDRFDFLNRFAPDASLIRQGLIALVPDPHQTAPPQLAHYLVPDREMFSWLLGSTALLPPLTQFCSLVEPTDRLADLPMSAEMRRGIASLLDANQNSVKGIRMILTGQSGNGQRETAGAIACSSGSQLIVADLAKLSTDEFQARDDLRLLFHHARLHQQLIFLDGLAERSETNEWLPRQVVDAMIAFNGISMLAIPGNAISISMIARDRPFIQIEFPSPDVTTRGAWWRFALGDRAANVAEETVRELASRYQLRPARIIGAVGDAQGIAAWSGDSAIDPEILMRAAHRQSSVQLDSFARKRTPSWHWDDIVLPSDQSAQLREIYDHARFRRIVHDNWKTPHLNHAAVGLNVLFSGASGTGKTMAAEVLAGALGLDLYTIEVPNTISKFIGETEKNIDRIFSAAYEGNVVLFFDEADAIFGKRSQVKDAHDRYANIEVGYLLQKVESHDGIVILGTNLRSNMDDAFTRRLHHVVEFPFPDEGLREQLWRKHLGGGMPLGKDVDPAFLARQFELAGGSIRAIVTNACFLAAAAQQPVGMTHVIMATRREFQKMGRVCDEQTFGDAIAMISPEPEERDAS